MPIGADDAIEKYGTKDVLGTSTSAITLGNFSDGTNDLVAWTNDDDAPLAAFALEFTTATTGDAYTTVDLFARLMDIGSAGTEDAQAPDGNFPIHYLGAFWHDNPITAAQTAGLKVALPTQKSSQIYNFYIQNNLGQTISAGWELSITPITYGPHA